MSRPSGSQYQHYIPRFLLRRFSTTPVIYRTGRNNRRQKVKRDEIVNVADLGKYPPEITEASLAETYGKYDMYDDKSEITRKEQKKMERKLSGLEGRASKIIARIIDAHRDGKDGIWLSRPNKDLLRKFLFVMKYRGPIYFKRFNHQTAEDYSSDDRIQFLHYMQENGFRRPLDVWFDNLNKIMDMALEFYLGAPTQTRGTYSIKTIRDRPDDPMLLLFRKLEHLAHQLGSDVKANYHVDALAGDNDEIRRAILHVMKELRKVTVWNPLGMIMFVLIGVLEKLRTDIPEMCTLDRILADQGRLPYPNVVFQAV